MNPLSAQPGPDPDGRWPVVFIMGPTASGKTELALAVADALPASLISVDSAMVYRGLDIGTAKPPRDVLARYPHALVDIRDPAEPYSAADFRADALAAMAAARDAGRIPVLVGGTMLYFSVLERGIARMPAADAALRRALTERAEREGHAALHAELARIDPEAAARIHPNDPQRLLRALEVHAVSGRPITRWWREQDDQAGWLTEFAPRRVALLPSSRAELHQRIEQRFDAMLAAGLLEEVRALRARGDLDPSLPALRAVGYRQAFDHLEGRCDHAEMRHRALVATRGLLRRQLTWLRRYPGVAGRTDTSPPNGAEPALQQVLDGLKSARAAAIVIRR